MPLKKSFEFKSIFSVEQVWEQLELKFQPPSFLIGNYKSIYRTSLKKRNNSLSFILIQTPIRGFPVTLYGEVISLRGQTKISGYVEISTTGLLLMIYFIIITAILAVVFRPVIWLSIFFVFGSIMSLQFLRIGLQSRITMINAIQNLLEE